MKLKYGYRADKKVYKAERNNDWAWWCLLGALIAMVAVFVYEVMCG